MAVFIVNVCCRIQQLSYVETPGRCGHSDRDGLECPVSFRVWSGMFVMGGGQTFVFILRQLPRIIKMVTLDPCMTKLGIKGFSLHLRNGWHNFAYGWDGFIF